MKFLFVIILSFVCVVGLCSISNIDGYKKGLEECKEIYIHEPEHPTAPSTCLNIDDVGIVCTWVQDGKTYMKHNNDISVVYVKGE